MCFLEEKQSDVAFGSSGDRQIFPSSVPHTRFGTELNTITGSPNLGPGHYKVEQVIIVFVQFITAFYMLTVLYQLYVEDFICDCFEPAVSLRSRDMKYAQCLLLIQCSERESVLTQDHRSVSVYDIHS